MSYAIICNARSGKNIGIKKLALIDRSKTKKSFWTTDDKSLIMCFRKIQAAHFTADKYKHNNAQVVRYDKAVSIIDDQNESINEAIDEINHHQASIDNELGWDGHKGTF